MARRSPPRKVTYFEPVPPRLARNTVIEFGLRGRPPLPVHDADRLRPARPRCGDPAGTRRMASTHARATRRREAGGLARRPQCGSSARRPYYGPLWITPAVTWTILVDALPNSIVEILGLKKEPVVTACTKGWGGVWKKMVEKQNLQITHNVQTTSVVRS